MYVHTYVRIYIRVCDDMRLRGSDEKACEFTFARSLCTALLCSLCAFAICAYMHIYVHVAHLACG